MPPTHTSHTPQPTPPATGGGLLHVDPGGPSPEIKPGEANASVRLGMPVLSASLASFTLKTRKSTREGDWSVFDIVHPLIERVGFFAVQAQVLETQAREAYDALFSLTKGLTLYRTWNYIPRINTWEEGQENYRRFCLGRSQSFHDRFGETATTLMPAASGVGNSNNHLVIAFIAGSSPATHIENPLQVPAYHYPDTYGPRAPSFARATLINGDRPIAFISGTAAIRGHESLAQGDVEAQTRLTMENLNRLMDELEAKGLKRARTSRRTFCIYLRKSSDREIVQRVLSSGFLMPQDHVVWVQADICRAELDLEIEALLEG